MHDSPHLRRVLGRWDLVLLFVVAVFNLNVVPSLAANGGVTVWLWIVALLLFFWPQGVAVIELAHRYPGEGGVYLWAKRVFGDFHGFPSGWCFGGSLFFVGLAAFFFFVYGRRKAPQEVASRAV
jgi:glutamate:GABA antiporter